VFAGVALSTAVTYVGIGMTVVGAITKNKNMMKVGGIMGIAGGVMSLAGIGTASAGIAAGSVVGEELTADAVASASADGVGEAGASAWGDAAAESASSLTADSFSTGGAGGIPGSAGAGSSAVTSGAPALTVDAGVQGSGVLNASVSPTGAYQPPPIPGASTPVVDNIMVDNAADLLPKSLPSAPSVPGVGGSTTKVPSSDTDKKAWWASLDTTTKNEIIKAGLAGASKFFEGWSQSEKAEWERDRLAEQQKNLNAQPRIQRYSPKTGLLNSNAGQVGR
jgi:hypothetical protein